MKLPDKTYDVLKWIVMIVIPALTAAYCGLAKIWNFPYPSEIAETSAIVCTLLGALLGISTAEYRKSEEQTMPRSNDRGLFFLYIPNCTQN